MKISKMFYAIAAAMPQAWRNQISEISWSQVNSIAGVCDDSDAANGVLNDLADRMMTQGGVPQRGRVYVSIVHAGWIGLLLFWCVDYWFSTWQLRAADVWTLGFVAFLLLMATVLYVACGLAVPGESELKDGADLVGFHSVNRRRYLGALFIYQALSIFGNMAIGPLQSAAFVNIGQLTLVGAAWLWPDRRVQLGAVAAMYVLTGWYAVHYIPAL